MSNPAPHSSKSEKKAKEEAKRKEEQIEEIQSLAWVGDKFKQYVTEDHEASVAAVAIRTLIELLRSSKSTTMMGLERELSLASKILQQQSSSFCVTSGAELFCRFVTRTLKLEGDFESCKKRILERGENFLQMAGDCRRSIAHMAERFIRDGVTILTHGYSRVVLSILLNAAEKGRRFSVLVTESRPDNVGIKTAERLANAGIPVTLIMDAGVGYAMEKVNLVLVGAEGVVENGGIINKIGTYGVSVIAKAMNKAVYVCAESFKFIRVYPLNQTDPEIVAKREQASVPSTIPIVDHPGLKVDNPSIDYTPPNYITLLFTDLGVLTPAAVSDELIKLYY